MAYELLKEQVFKANLELVKSGLVVLTWGNASGADRKAGVFGIKPSGVAYDKLRPDDIVILSIETGQVVEGSARPSSDTPTHWHFYKKWESVNGAVHTHSLHATSFSQAHKDLPCFGTTHADNFHGTIPCTRPLTQAEIDNDYELNTGKVIVDCFARRKIDPSAVPAVLVAGHAPFAWGPTPDKAVENAIVLEFAAQMAINTLALNPKAHSLPKILQDKHYLRKHGAKAYYGQK